MTRTAAPSAIASVVRGMMALTRNRVAPIDAPPSTLETTAANTPQTSVIANPLFQSCAP